VTSAMTSKSLSRCSTVSPASSAVAAMIRSGIDGARCWHRRPAAVQEARDQRALKVRAEYLTEMRKKAGLTQAEVADAMSVSQQRVSAIENGAVAELATLAD
jgi:DNA-binding XRE family transcriptional regulator